MAKLNKTTKALVDHAIRQFRSLDVLGWVEESLTFDQYKAAEAYLAKLQAEKAEKDAARMREVDKQLQARYPWGYRSEDSEP